MADEYPRTDNCWKCQKKFKRLHKFNRQCPACWNASARLSKMDMTADASSDFNTGRKQGKAAP